MSLYLGNTVISGVTTPLNGSIAIGQIISSIIPLTDAGLHLLDGSLIQGGGVYDAFVQYIANLVNLYPQCFTDEATWQSTVSSKGVCGKFVYDSVNNTVRLPKITGFIEGTINNGDVGDIINAGLPDHTHHIAVYNAEGSATGGGYVPGSSFDAGSVIVNSGTNGESGNGNWTDRSTNYGYNTNRNQMNNASSVNSIYGNSSTVQPQSIKVFYYIVVATTTKTEIEVDIDDVITDLNMLNNNVIHRTTNEYYTGQKNRNIEGLDTSTTQWIDGNSAILTQYDDVNFVNSIDYYYNIVKDGQNRYLLYNTCAIFNNGIKNQLSARTRNTANTANVNCDFTLYAFKDGTTYVEAPASDINGSIVTTVNKSKSENGYFQLGNGLIINWGRTSNTQQTNVTFSKAYSSANSYAVIAVPYTSSNSNQDGYSCYVTNLSATGCTIWNKMYGSSISAIKHWIAIGY